MVFYDCFFAQMDMLKVHAAINLAYSEKEWSNFVQVTLKIIYSSVPCHASLFSSGCLEWDVHTLPLINMLTRPKINYGDPVDEWRGWFVKKFYSCIGGIWSDTQKFGYKVDCIGHRRFTDWEADVRVIGRSQWEMTSAKGPVIIYRVEGGFWGHHLIFRRTKRGISRHWEPKRGDHRKLCKDSEGGPPKFAWKMKTWWGGGVGSRESSNVIRRDHFSAVTFKGGIG